MSFISKLLGLGRRFSGTPEQYLAMVQYMAQKNNPEYSPEVLLQWGEVMQKVMKVNLTPYLDFKDLAERGVPDNSMVAKVDEKSKEINQRKDLKQAIYGTNVDLGDYREAVYSANESRYARILDKIKAVDQGFGLTDEDVVGLNYSSGELFWRVPAQRELISSATSLNQMNQLGVAVIDRRTMKQVNPDQFAESIKDDLYYTKRLRNVLPATNYWNMVDCTWPCRAVTFPNPFPAICSDNPVILRHPEKADAFLDDLIFPLSPNKVFFRIKGMREIYAPNIKFYIDMLMVLQASEYVCYIDQEYIQRLIAVFEQNFSSMDEVREFIFEYLTES